MKLRMVNRISADERKRINSYLLEAGYCRGVLDDETQAYLVYGLEWLEEIGVKEESLLEMHNRLREVFKKYIPKKII